MGCVSSTLLEDDDRRIVGVSSHIVSLTSSTYGILTTLGAGGDADAHSDDPPHPPLPKDKEPSATAEEVINSWELMAGLLDPSTPAKSRRSDKDRQHAAAPARCIRPVDGNSSSTSTPTGPPPPPQTRTMERRCPPGGAHSAVLYTTTLRGVRSTFEACNAVRAALQSHAVAFRERDVSMDRGFREELRDLTRGLPAAVPRLFVRGRHVGGAEEVLGLDEEGALAALLEGLPRARGGSCDGCGGMRFLPCFECCGSRKVVVESAAKGKQEQEQGRLGSRSRGRGVVVRCGECNENGLVLCPICC